MTDDSGASNASSGRARVSQLFEESAAAVHATARRITGNPADAEDVLQGVFLNLLQASQAGSGRVWPDNPVGYVQRAAVNASLDVLRRRTRWPQDEVDPALPARTHADEERSLIGTVAGKELALRLRGALTHLTPLEAEVFALRAFEDLGNAEIATLVDKTPNHVGVTLHAARTKLKALLTGRAPLATGIPPATGDTSHDR